MNEEKLILYYYDDGLDDDERREIRDALADDALLAARYRRLVDELTLLADAPVPPIADDVSQRLHVALDRAADLELGRRQAPRARNNGISFLLGAAVAAALAVAIGLNLRTPAGTSPDGDGPAAGPGTTLPLAREDSPPAFARAMQVYFRDSRQEVQGLPDAGDGRRAEMILDLVAQNRSFARLAMQNDAPDLARVLRAFEPILNRLADDSITAEESEALRAKLAFELNVMLTKLTREASEYAPPTEQET